MKGWPTKIFRTLNGTNMKQKTFRYFVGDFETTVFDGQEDTEVWASAVVEMFSEDVKIFHSINDTFEYLKSLDTNVCIYYHNLKFDGAFWISFLMYDLQFKQAITESSNEENYQVKFQYDSEMKNNTFKYIISSMGQWYTISIKVNNHIIELRDSLKLLPFSVDKIGKSFETKHKKLDMEYIGFRYAGCTITEEEQKYIANDVLVVKEALEIMFKEGHKKLTIGACCLSEFKSEYQYYDYQKMFPNLLNIELEPFLYKYTNADEYIRKSYKGGWCYVVKGKENKIFENGITADVNSLYPSMMSSESGNRYPIGKPHFWKGNFIPVIAKLPDKYYFVRIKTRFYLKPNRLPCIQIKNNLLYRAREWLESSDVYNYATEKFCKSYIDADGTVQDARVILTLTMTDYELIKEQYDLIDFEILDGCWFDSQIGIFDLYIEKYKKIKLESKGAKRELAKLFLNNLYGKMASSPDSSFKFSYLKDDNSIGFVEIKEFDKKPGYIPIGSAITSYARNFTIRTAQQNFYGPDKPGFIYADTDSIHCDLPANQIKGIKVHDKNFCCWKLESSWDQGIFVRPKTYIEHIIAENLQAIDKPYYNIKCAGMGDKCKELFKMSMQGKTKEEWIREDDKTWNSLNQADKDFVLQKRDLKDYKLGLKIPGKLVPKRIRGGVVLVETTYEMR